MNNPLELVSSVHQTEDNGTEDTGATGIEFSSAKAGEVSRLLQATVDQLTLFISKADRERLRHQMGGAIPVGGTSLVVPDSMHPATLQTALKDSLSIAEDGVGILGFEKTLKDLVDYSVNPSAPGFMDKLYAAPLPPGIAAELILAVLNTNAHVYQVSPVLTIVEKLVTRKLVSLFGLDSPRAGGISVQGGSASNLTSIVVARNSLFPDTKSQGNNAGGRQLLMFTSAHGHYSVEKAAQGLGFGTSAVIAVATDDMGVMRPDELERQIVEAKQIGKTPFYINATAGTTVLGSFDPFTEISSIARKHRCWFHIDGAWGASFVFSQRKDLSSKLKGAHMADSIAINPHKMLGVPLTCSLLLTRDLKLFQSAMTLKAGYLFHDTDDDVSVQSSDAVDDETAASKDVAQDMMSGTKPSPFDLRDTEDPSWTEPNDLADMTLQCGRRADSLKLFMCWQYYGTRGYASMIEAAYDIAIEMAQLVDSKNDLALVLGPSSKPSCLQVCFYYTPDKKFVYGLEGKPSDLTSSNVKGKVAFGKLNTKVTSRISKALISRGFMVDFAPALEGQEDKGSFLRVVVNISTVWETVDRLVDEILVVGAEVVKELM